MVGFLEDGSLAFVTHKNTTIKPTYHEPEVGNNAAPVTY